MKIFLLLALLSIRLAAESYIGYGECMAPALISGQRVHVMGEAYANLKVGDLVAFTWEGQLVASRLIERTPAGWVTKGDANAYPDLGLMTSKTFKGKIAGPDDKKIITQNGPNARFDLYPDDRAYACVDATPFTPNGYVIVRTQGSGGAPHTPDKPRAPHTPDGPKAPNKTPDNPPPEPPKPPVVPPTTPVSVPESFSTAWLLGLSILSLLAGRIVLRPRP